MAIFQDLDKNLRKKIKKNVLLAPYTTFKIGGPAKYFIETDNEKELVDILKFCQKKRIAYFILGGGSNLLVSDKGFTGMVTKIRDSLPAGDLQTIKKLGIRNCHVKAGSGISLSKLILETKKHNLSGLEYLTGIPGTLGGAIFGNVGARYPFGGAEIGNFVTKVRFLDSNLKIMEFDKKQCMFSYRHSYFKNQSLKKKPVVILSAVLKLRSGNREGIEMVIEKINLHRKKNPIGFSAGCVFKNFKITNEKELSADLRKLSPEKFIEQKKIPAGWLIDQCHLRGKKIGGAKISERHANFIINEGGAKAADVKKLIDLTRQRVKKKFNLTLQEENILVGF